MKNRKKYGVLALSLALCLSFAACGSDSGENNDGGDTDGMLSVTGYSDPVEDNADLETAEAPGSFEGLVKDSMLLPDENTYLGTWLGEDNSELIVELSEAGDEVRFALYDPSDEITASGFIQYVPDYSADYFYNEHDGMAYHSWMGDSGELQVDGIGTFSKVSGDVPGETVAIWAMNPLRAPGIWTPKPMQSASLRSTSWATGPCMSVLRETAIPTRWTMAPSVPIQTARICMMPFPTCLRMWSTI